LNYEDTIRYHILIDIVDSMGASISMTLVFDILDVFDPPISIDWVNTPNINSGIKMGSVVGKLYADGEEEYNIMLQNHLDKFALIDNTIVTNNIIPAGIYNFQLAVNEYNYNLNLIVDDIEIPINNPPVCEELLKITIKDDINIGTTIGNVNCSDRDNLQYNIITIDKMIKDIVNISSSGRIYIVNTPSTRKAIMGKYIIGLNVSDGVNNIKMNILVSMIDDCYEMPCGSNTCTDMFNTYICKCKNGFVGISCDPEYIKNVEASTADKNDLSNMTLVGITFGAIVLIIIIVLMIIAVFRKPSNKTTDIESNKMICSWTKREPVHLKTVKSFSNGAAHITNPIFINPNNFENNNMDGCSNPMYHINDGNFVVRDNKNTPSWHQLSVRYNGTIYNDMIRTHLNGTYELVAQNRNIGMQPTHNTIDDLIKYYSTDRDIGYILNGFNPNGFNPNGFNNPMYMDINRQGINPTWINSNGINAPALPLKNNQKDMIRSLANDDANEVYGNIADAKIIIINDMNL
jgi:hypothetical protein